MDKGRDEAVTREFKRLAAGAHMPEDAMAKIRHRAAERHRRRTTAAAAGAVGAVVVGAAVAAGVFGIGRDAGSSNPVDPSPTSASDSVLARCGSLPAVAAGSDVIDAILTTGRQFVAWVTTRTEGGYRPGEVSGVDPNAQLVVCELTSTRGVSPGSTRPSASGRNVSVVVLGIASRPVRDLVGPRVEVERLLAELR